MILVRFGAVLFSNYAMSAGIITALRELIVEIRFNGCDATELGVLQQIHNLSGQVVREGALMAQRSQRWAVEGFPSAGRWVASHTGLPVPRAHGLLREANSLEHMTHTQAVAREGFLDDARVQVLTGCQRAAPAQYDAEVERPQLRGRASRGRQGGQPVPEQPPQRRPHP